MKTRALIHSGAHVSLASTHLAHTLKLPRRKHLTRLSGVAGAHTIDSHYTATIKLISPDDPTETLSLTVVLLKNVLPDMEPIDSKAIRDDVAFKGLKFADPDYDRAGKIDLLLGVGVCAWLTLRGSIVNKERTITASQTLYGWMLEGNLPGRKCKCPSVLTVHTVSLDSEFSSLSKFWELEELPATSKLSPEEQTALDHFNSTLTRHPNGRFEVYLPKKDSCSLGCSREQAQRRYLCNERSLQRKGCWNQFSKEVQNYFDLGHAEPVPQEDLPKPENQCYYLPMHGVTKLSSTTTKLRVVFDASAATSTGKLLNDILLPGPCAYPLISDILLQFRLHKFAITGDISKMFREVSLSPADRDLHRFLWRPQPGGPLREGRMTRVAFGVASSPVLATQALRQTAIDHHLITLRRLRSYFRSFM